LITHCPSCRTHFRVHAEQLAARAGQVRCGKCSQVFDALEHLIEEIAPVRAPRPQPESEAVRADTAEAEHAPESADSEALDIGAAAQVPIIAQASDVVAKAPEPGAETPEATISEPVLAEPANVDADAASGASSFDFGPGAAVEPDGPVRRWPWVLGALLLLLILLAQAAYHYRSVITLLFPESKPYAVALCATLGCELPLPRRIEQMSIDASDLQADTTNPSVMVLSATLKNRAIFNQQHPLLELTLTDAQDQPVVRRVLAPQDYLGKAVNTQAGFAANTEIAIKVFIEGSQVKATGYRLYLFYP
jgi:predicted Zn finger-like uncharacterized protein